MQSKELEKEILEIKTSAEEIGIYLKGLTGQKSHLSEYEWLLVRTNAFKEEFGDWEQYFKCKFLLEYPEVSILSGEEFAPMEGKTLTDQVEEYFIRLGGKVITPFFGEVTLDRKGADDSLAHGMGRLKAIAYAAVKDVIEKGILVHYDFNHKGRGYNSAVLAAPILIKEERYICYVTITRKNQSNRFYLHEVWTEKNLTSVRSNAVLRQPSHLQGVAKILQNILSAKDIQINISLDENGEPILKSEI